jgi:orotidine-5'-phosphate decarboxylase
LPALDYNPIIVALDFESKNEAMALVAAVGPGVDFYKVGMELFTAEGPLLLRELQDQGKKVFLDLKFHDIQETVKRAVARAAELRVDLLTVHATGQVMRAAVEGRGSSCLRVLGVTVLTSLAESDLVEEGFPADVRISDLVARKVRLGVASGMDGFVCSPLEVARVREIAGPRAALVTPGVRSAGAARGDQQRVATPGEAIAAGSSYLVIGRQITRAADPAGEARRILDEIAAS